MKFLPKRGVLFANLIALVMIIVVGWLVYPSIHEFYGTISSIFVVYAP